MKKYQPLSREFLLERGYCCHKGCKNCPYTKKISTTSHRETSNKTKTKKQ